MGNRISFENQAIARTLSAKFPIDSEISIDEFDMFIIDQKFTKDPETNDLKDPRYKGFVQDRNTAKNAINRAAATLDNGDRFVIKILEAGKRYQIAPWGEETLNIAKDVGDRIHLFAEGKKKLLTRLKNNVESLYIETGGDDSVVEDLRKMVSMIREEGLTLEVKIKSLVAHFNIAVDAVESQIRIAHDEHKALEDKSE